MAHEKPDSRDRNFGYPPVPRVYTNSLSTFGGLQRAALMENTEPEPSRYPYHDHYATASFTPSPGAFSYPENIDENLHIRNAPAIPPALSPDYSHLAPPTFTGHEVSPRNAGNITPTVQKRSPRGSTGDVVCDECGYKFTKKSSLNRHSKTCHGKNPSQKQLQARPKSMETKVVGFHSDNNTDAMSVNEAQRNQQDNKDQDAGYNGNLERISAANTMIESQGPSKASSTSNSATPMSYQWPWGTQPYVPQGPDTSEDHANFGCDLCPVIVARRDILQMHKSEVHGMTESPFVPESGSVNMPPYLEGVTLENASHHSRRALRMFQGGALSSSPCRHCMSRGLDCIVNPFLSSLCARCNYYDNGTYCGAAGVKYRKPRGVIDDPRVTTTISKNYTQPMEQRPRQAVPEAPYPGVPSRPKENQHSRIPLMDHSVSTSPEPRYYASSSSFNPGV